MTPNVITIRAGTNRAVTFTVDVSRVPLAAVFELVVSSPTLRLVYTESTGLSKVLNGQTVQVTWSYSLADSRAFPQGRIATVELQWTVGSVQDSDVGQLEVLPGASND
jgi:hypothetical protein